MPIKKLYGKDCPIVHLTSPTGHLNDPNGLLFDGKNYHIFYPNYPYAQFIQNTEIGSDGVFINLLLRQEWGHFITQNFVDYTVYPNALHHSLLGSAWSGSGVVDYQNVRGLCDGKTPPILLFYTA